MIEVIIVFLGFLFAIFTILIIVNCCSAHMMISNGVDILTKGGITQYANFYKMRCFQKFNDDMSNVVGIGSENINNILATTDNLYQLITTAVDNTVEHSTNIINGNESVNLNQHMVRDGLFNIEVDGTNGSDEEYLNIKEKFTKAYSDYILQLGAMSKEESSEYANIAINVEIVVKEELNKNGIVIPYNQVVIHNERV